MITRVWLSNWRAYREVELQTESGTTFLVAMNGVGKSSLLEAVQWVFTRASKPDAEWIRKESAPPRLRWSYSSSQFRCGSGVALASALARSR